MNQLADRSVARRNRRLLAEILFGGFYRCPTTGTVITALHGDDKALCRCGHSNPHVWQERTEQTGVHIVRFLTPVSVDAYIDQEEQVKDARARKGTP